jgi:hypothetical protein
LPVPQLTCHTGERTLTFGLAFPCDGQPGISRRGSPQ